MYKELSLITIPALGGACIVCSTMHLTNTSDNSSWVLDPLNIKDKPNIPEDKLHPHIIPPPPPPPKKEESEESEEEEEEEEEEEAGKQEKSQEEHTDHSDSSGASQGSSDPDIALKECLLRINNFNGSSLIDRSLKAAFNVISTTNDCNTILQQHAKKISDQTQTEASSES